MTLSGFIPKRENSPDFLCMNAMHKTVSSLFADSNFSRCYIWELDYGLTFKVLLFRCKWVKMTAGGVQVDKTYGMTTVDLNNLAYLDEPFVLANDVAQVFYVKDMSTKPRKRKNEQKDTSDDEPKRHIVLSGKRNIVGVEDKTDMSRDYDKFHEIPPFSVKDMTQVSH